MEMELKDYVEMGEKVAGSAIKLAETLGVARSSISDAKAHRRGLPLPACYHLADLIGADHRAIAAASALVTEKDEKVREYLRPFAQNWAKAAGIFMTLSGLVMFSTAPKEANAAPVLEPVTLKVTESARNALPFSKTRPNDLYYVK
ncbi:hypothetical protein Dsui_2549 [Azospira oryzae PS]|uniref:Uncharacterized protein n=1 Tax=Azospira oryzae (strain ATCC BAA-33 / DSM 13638 / PS) TaxID=640081 RepID=G8QN60_AZOOP|nr:hypothetical protein [Azospira oryzae]AEV26900.1 hypothetical protein Dsui_2549 [Azospira oryzae PS]